MKRDQSDLFWQCFSKQKQDENRNIALTLKKGGTEPLLSIAWLSEKSVRSTWSGNMLVRLPLRYLLESSLGKDCQPKDTNSVLKCTLSLDCGLWVMVIGYGYWLWFWIVHWSYQVATKSSTFAIAHFMLRKFDICLTYWNYTPKTFLNS